MRERVSWGKYERNGMKLQIPNSKHERNSRRIGIALPLATCIILSRATGSVEINVESVFVAAGGLHEFAVPFDGAGSWRARSGNNRPGECAVAAGEKSEGIETDRDFCGRQAFGGTVVWFDAGRDA